MKTFNQIIIKRFSQTTRIERLLSKRYKEESIYKKIMFKKDKVYDGMTEKNTNLITKKKDNTFYPIQHPKRINNEDTNIISYKPPVRNLTPYFTIDKDALRYDHHPFTSPHDSKGIDVGIIGPPNSGKSSLLNYIVGENISAVSTKYNTTYKRTEGVYTDINSRTQLMLVDTPGAIKISRSLNSKKIITKSWDVILDSDKVMFVVDSVKRLDSVTREAIKRFLSLKFNPNVIKVLSKIKNYRDNDVDLDEVAQMTKENIEFENKKTNVSCFLVMNKIDLCTNKRRLRSLQEELEDLGAFEKTFHVSSLTGFGMDNLKNYLLSCAERREWKFHPNAKSSKSDIEKAEEIVTQYIFDRFYKEIPYESLCMVTSWVPFSNGELQITFNIELKNNVQVKMFIGKDGTVIKDLTAETEKGLTSFFKKPVKVKMFTTLRRKEYNSNHFTNTGKMTPDPNSIKEKQEAPFENKKEFQEKYLDKLKKN